jgi:hypothetical protein
LLLVYVGAESDNMRGERGQGLWTTGIEDRTHGRRAVDMIGQFLHPWPNDAGTVRLRVPRSLAHRALVAAAGRLWRTAAPRGGSAYSGVVDGDEWLGFSPTCAQCLLQLEPVLIRDSPVWRCPSCGLVRITT